MNTANEMLREIRRRAQERIEALHQKPQEIGNVAHEDIWRQISHLENGFHTPFDHDFIIQASAGNPSSCYATEDSVETIQELNEADREGRSIVLYTWNPEYYVGKLNGFEMSIQVKHVKALFH